ncbi:MAG TPA: DNA integrity scanning protein DisA nucleotide-binding domain protein [Phormidium sp.]
MLSSLSFLADELKQNGIATDIPELIQYPNVLAELSYALRPVVHEGKLQPYGFIATEKSGASVITSPYEKLLIKLPEARRVADGCYSFSIFKSGQFQSVYMPKYAAYTELQLVQLQQELDAIIGITDANGITKLFCKSGLFIHQYRSWQKKPCINRALHNILRCAPQAKAETLKNLLEFCFHDLSPRKIGATLVWCLTEPSIEEWEDMSPNFMLEEIETQIGSDRSVAVLRHLLTYTDGAVILDAQARAIGVGAQLKYSEASKRLIEAHTGTRHTSAQRFSYDFSKGIVFVVSSDGPITVFSDGMSVTDLEIHSIDKTLLENTAEPSMPEAANSPCLGEVICKGCKKRLKIQEIDSGEFKKQERSLHCPICSHFIQSANCSNLDLHVVKALEEPIQLAQPIKQNYIRSIQ